MQVESEYLKSISILFLPDFVVFWLVKQGLAKLYNTAFVFVILPNFLTWALFVIECFQILTFENSLHYYIIYFLFTSVSCLWQVIGPKIWRNTWGWWLLIFSRFNTFWKFLIKENCFSYFNQSTWNIQWQCSLCWCWPHNFHLLWILMNKGYPHYHK